MTLDQEIEYWRRASNAAKTKEAALIAFGIHAGLRIAKNQHGVNDNITMDLKK
jgi:hypothetical protein